jgi:hypothetical protein
MVAEMEGERESLFDDWLDFWGEEPFGPSVQNLMMARVANAMSGGGEAQYIPGVQDDG